MPEELRNLEAPESIDSNPDPPTFWRILAELPKTWFAPPFTFCESLTAG
jgi:hypothetical protein